MPVSAMEVWKAPAGQPMICVGVVPFLERRPSKHRGPEWEICYPFGLSVMSGDQYIVALKAVPERWKCSVLSRVDAASVQKITRKEEMMV